jgi:hypothetical protein
VFLTTIGNSGCIPTIIAYVRQLHPCLYPLSDILSSTELKQRCIAQQTDCAISSNSGFCWRLGPRSDQYLSHKGRSALSPWCAPFCINFAFVDLNFVISGLSATLGSQALLLVLLIITTLYFSRQNRLMRAGKLSKPLQGQPGFYYTL